MIIFHRYYYNLIGLVELIINTMNYQSIISELYHTIKAMEDKGQLSSYIPELAGVDKNSFGVHISTVDGFEFGIGDFRTRFSIQSIAKVLSVCLAYKMEGGFFSVPPYVFVSSFVRDVLGLFFLPGSAFSHNYLYF